MEKAQQNIEKLKDADREIVYKNGNGEWELVLDCRTMYGCIIQKFVER